MLQKLIGTTGTGTHSLPSKRIITNNFKLLRKQENEVRHQQKHRSNDAKSRSRTRKRGTFALATVKRHAPAHRSNAFPCPWQTRKWSLNHVSRPLREGNKRNDGKYRGKM